MTFFNKIIKAKYDDSRYWFTSPKTLKTILSDPDTSEMFIIFKNKYNEKDFDLLTNLAGSKVIIGNDIVDIPDLYDA